MFPPNDFLFRLRYLTEVFLNAVEINNFSFFENMKNVYISIEMHLL